MTPTELNEKQLSAIAAGKKTEELSDNSLIKSLIGEMERQAEDASDIWKQ